MCSALLAFELGPVLAYKFGPDSTRMICSWIFWHLGLERIRPSGRATAEPTANAFTESLNRKLNLYCACAPQGGDFLQAPGLLHYGRYFCFYVRGAFPRSWVRPLVFRFVCFAYPPAFVPHSAGACCVRSCASCERACNSCTPSTRLRLKAVMSGIIVYRYEVVLFASRSNVDASHAYTPGRAASIKMPIA